MRKLLCAMHEVAAVVGRKDGLECLWTLSWEILSLNSPCPKLVAGYATCLREIWQHNFLVPEHRLQLKQYRTEYKKNTCEAAACANLLGHCFVLMLKFSLYSPWMSVMPGAWSEAVDIDQLIYWIYTVWRWNSTCWTEHVLVKKANDGWMRDQLTLFPRWNCLHPLDLNFQVHSVSPPSKASPENKFRLHNWNIQVSIFV